MFKAGYGIYNPLKLVDEAPLPRFAELQQKALAGEELSADMLPAWYFRHRCDQVNGVCLNLDFRLNI